MLGVLVHLSLLLCAGAALFFICRNVAKQNASFGVLIAIGLVGRSVLAQVLFWISYLDLIRRANHFGGGIWFFGTDGYEYMSRAVQIAYGHDALLVQTRASVSAAFVDLLAVFVLLFGSAASIAVLLNLFCYAGICWLAGRCSTAAPEAVRPALFAIAAFTFYPAGVLWSTQPLKDTLVHFLLAGLITAALLWQTSWKTEPRPLWIAGAFAGMAISVYVISGSRWYLGMALLGAVGVFVVLLILTTPRRRMVLAGCSLLLLFVLSRAFLYGGGEVIPTAVQGLFSPATASASANGFGSAMEVYSAKARTGFVKIGGGTQIQLRSGSSRGVRIGAGVLAVFVPHFIIEHLGFVHIGGGRGLFWFADADTAVFDAVAVSAIFLTLRGRPRLRTNPLLVLVILTLLFVSLPLFDAVTNFGTLLRFRGMMYVSFAMAPLAAVLGGTRREASSGAGE